MYTLWPIEYDPDLQQKVIEPRNRGWVDVDPDLERFAGHRIDIEFTTRCQSSISRDEVMGGFEILGSPPHDALAPVGEVWQSGIPLEIGPDAFYPLCGSPVVRLRCRITGFRVYGCTECAAGER